MPSLLGKWMGAAKPAQPQGPPVPMGGGLTLTPGSSASASPDLTLIRAFKQNGTNFANVSLIARSVAAQKWGMYRSAAPSNRYTTSDQGSDQRKQLAVHAALDVLNSPASITVSSPRGPRRVPVWTRTGLFQISQIWLEQTGKSYWIVDNAEDSSPVPLGVWPVRPDRLVPVPDRDKYLAGWWYRSPDGREQIPLRPDEVIFARYPDPEDPYGGCGPVRSVLTDIQAADYAAEWNKNYFINSAEPGGVIQVDHELQEDEFDDLVTRWRETHRGVARAHRIAILEAGQTWVANGHSARDMDFANLRSVMRDTIREALAMHKVMTGVSDDVNRANAQTGEEVFASWIVAPRLDLWRDVLNTQFLPLFGTTAEGNEFDYAFPTPVNREQDALELTSKANAVLSLVTAGYDQEDVLRAVGLPSMKAVLTLSDQPALPPRWTAGAPAAPAGGDAVPAPAGSPQAALRAAAGWSSPLWAALDAVPAPRRALPAGYGPGPVLAKDATAKVFEQVAGDYPPEAMAWMHHASWAGPVRVPLDHIEPDMAWMDGADPDHVADFVKRRQKGKKLKPLLLVKTPGSPKLHLVDGHHRYLAEAELGEAPRAWIGTVDADHGDWETMHEHQLRPSAGGGAGRSDAKARQAREMAIWNQLAGAR